MRERTRPGLKRLLDRKEIRRSKPTTDIIVNELDGSTSDLEAAKHSLETGAYKWATIQSYHSMFHAARALLNRLGYNEKSHEGLLAALHLLYEKGIVEKMLEDFSKARTLAERLHDGQIGSNDLAEKAVENATDFLEQTARILAAPREWFERPAPRPPRARNKKR